MQKRSIPFFSLKEQAAQYKPLFLEGISEVLDNQNFVGGATVQNFENKLATYLNVPHVISCNSGTDALWLALTALDLQPESIVLTTPFSFIASSSEIVALRAHPVFIDIDPKTFNLSPTRLAEWLEKNAIMQNGQATDKKTGLAIVGMVLVDLFGQCAEFKAIREITNKWNLWIVEDACQAIGATEDGKKAGTLGDIGTFSFYPTKNLGAYGEGGACMTENPYLAEKLFRLRNHGRKIGYEYEELGINSRLDGIQAAVLSIKLDLLDGFNNRRRAIAQQYYEKLAGLTTITLPKEVYGHHVYHQFCVTTETHEMRVMLQKHLTEAGIGTNIFYPKSLYDIPFLSTHKDLVNPCPVTHQATQTILALPIWPELDDKDIEYICEKIKEFDQKFVVTPKQPAEKKRSMKKEERTQQISLF